MFCVCFFFLFFIVKACDCCVCCSYSYDVRVCVFMPIILLSAATFFGSRAFRAANIQWILVSMPPIMRLLLLFTSKCGQRQSQYKKTNARYVRVCVKTIVIHFFFHLLLLQNEHRNITINVSMMFTVHTQLDWKYACLTNIIYYVQLE